MTKLIFLSQQCLYETSTHNKNTFDGGKRFSKTCFTTVRIASWISKGTCKRRHALKMSCHLRKILGTGWQDAVYFSEIKARQVCFVELLCSWRIPWTFSFLENRLQNHPRIAPCIPKIFPQTLILTRFFVLNWCTKIVQLANSNDITERKIPKPVRACCELRYLQIVCN